MTKPKILGIRIDTDTDKALVAAAYDLDRTPSWVARKAIEEYLQKRRSQ